MENFDLGTFLFYAFLGWLTIRILHKYLERQNQEMKGRLPELKEKIKKNIVPVTIEKHGDIYYAFERETNTFVAQGRTANEIREAMQKRFPEKTFMANEQHLKELGLDL